MALHNGDIGGQTSQPTLVPLRDPCTGLAHPALFHDRLARLEAYARRHPGHLFALAIADVQPAAQLTSEVIAQIGARMAGAVRDLDTVVYLESGRFAVLLDHIGDMADIEPVANRLQNILTKSCPAWIPPGNIGWAAQGDSRTWRPTSPQRLMHQADVALCRAKLRGPGTWEIFVGEHQGALTTTTLTHRLRHALARREFRVHYQPIVSLSDGRIAGFEALVRWESSEYGLVEPNQFIRIAEESGLIVSIGHWVMHTALAQLRDWRAEGLATKAFMSVNLSPRQLHEAGLASHVANILNDVQIEASALHLEITENLLIDNIENATLLLGRLRDLGVKLCLDDFGVGYSSLNTLYSLPVQTLKIDRSFVARLLENPKCRHIVRTIMMLAHTLKMDVIAEGIETTGQLDFLRARRCEYGQGYHFGKPQNATDLRLAIDLA